MSSGLLSAAIVQRDGTGQAQRQKPALDPDYIPLEERSLTDWIAFAQQYAGELNFFDENNEATGSWKNFLSDIDIPTLLAYVENTDTFSAKQEIIEKYSQPHLVL